MQAHREAHTQFYHQISSNDYASKTEPRQAPGARV